jgi:hypothetical protein
MSNRDFAMALAMLAEGFGEKGLTPVRIEAYQRGLEGVPQTVLNAAVQRAIKTRQWFPKVAELREDCEACRREMRGALKHEPCASCEDTPGWITVTEGNVQRMKRCICWTIHLRKVEELGAGDSPLALPAAREFSRLGEDDAA